MEIRYFKTTSCGDIFLTSIDIMIWQVNINNWQVKIWQVDIIIWQVMAEICHHRFWIVVNVLYYFSILLLFPLWAGRDPSFERNWISSSCISVWNKPCRSVEFFFNVYVPFSKIGPKGCQCIYMYSLLREHYPSTKQTWIPITIWSFVKTLF